MCLLCMRIGRLVDCMAFLWIRTHAIYLNGGTKNSRAIHRRQNHIIAQESKQSEE